MLEKKKKIDTLQILRAIAFLEIFLGHCGISFFTGAFGVSIFIVLSGFCMAINYLPKAETINLSPISNVKYAISKIKKLYGLHLFMLACAFLLAQMPTSGNAMKRMLMDILLIQSWSPHVDDFFSYNGVAWYLSTYFFICMAALYIIKLLSKIKDKKTIVAISVLVYAGMAAVGFYVSKKPIPVGNDFAFWLTYISPIYRVFEFFLGAALGWLYFSREGKVQGNKGAATLLEVLVAAAFIGVICIFHKTEGVYNGLCYTALFTPVSLLLVAVFAGSNGLLMKALNNRFFLWLGNLSTYTFLIHQIVIWWLQSILDPAALGANYRAILTLCSFLITVCGAELVIHLGKIRKK